jgi:hypothetical protein
MDERIPPSAWEELFSIQQEYEGICRKAWSLRAERDPRQQADLDRELSAVMRRVEQVLQTQPVPGLYR